MEEIQTQRLFLSKIDYCDSTFYIELVNTPGWLKYIGNKNIHNTLDANNYIKNILSNLQTSYWTVHLKAEQKPIGAISLIKRDYLDAHDLGFAFLPLYTHMGYAYEATHAIIEQLKREQIHSLLYAIAIPENKSSIQLLMRLGFHFVETITAEGEVLNLYKLTLKEEYN